MNLTECKMTCKNNIVFRVGLNLTPPKGSTPPPQKKNANLVNDKEPDYTIQYNSFLKKMQAKKVKSCDEIQK